MAENQRKAIHDLTLGIDDEPFSLPQVVCTEAVRVNQFSLVGRPLIPRRQNIRAIVASLLGVSLALYLAVLWSRDVSSLCPSKELMQRLRGVCKTCGLLTHDTGDCTLHLPAVEPFNDDDDNNRDEEMDDHEHEHQPDPDTANIGKMVEEDREDTEQQRVSHPSSGSREEDVLSREVTGLQHTRNHDYENEGATNTACARTKRKRTFIERLVTEICQDAIFVQTSLSMEQRGGESCNIAEKWSPEERFMQYGSFLENQLSASEEDNPQLSASRDTGTTLYQNPHNAGSVTQQKALLPREADQTKRV